MSVTHSDPVQAGNNARAYEYGRLRNDVAYGWIRPQYNTSGNESAPVYATETWTYASATTITVPTDATERYAVGDKIRIKQGAGYKYFYIVTVAATLLTVTGGSDYTVANSAITDNYVSKAASPVGFPQWFAYTPTWAGYSSDPTGITARFSLNGRLCTVVLSCSANGTSNTTSNTVTVPITSAQAVTLATLIKYNDNSITSATPGYGSLAASSNILTMYKDLQATVWTGSGQKSVNFTLQYEI